MISAELQEFVRFNFENQFPVPVEADTTVYAPTEEELRRRQVLNLLSRLVMGPNSKVLGQ